MALSTYVLPFFVLEQHQEHRRIQCKDVLEEERLLENGWINENGSLSKIATTDVIVDQNILY